jgi:hypothetical protein
MSGPLSDAVPTLSPVASDDNNAAGPTPVVGDSEPPPLTDLERFTRLLLDAGVRLPETEES